MNKEEIEESKKSLNETIQNTYAERKAIKLDNLRKYIQHLEQKSEILDKVTDKLKEEKLTIESTYSQINGNYFMAQDRLDLINEILNIIEGE